MLPEIDRILISRDEINERVSAMGKQLSADLSEAVRADGYDPLAHPDRVVMVPILTGAMVFASDLIRAMPMKLSLRLVTVSSYPGQSTESKGAAMRSALPPDLADRHVVLIDDILDTGSTLRLVSDLVREQSPASIRTCVLLDKPDRRTHDVTCDYRGFPIPDEFVVGYGLDFDGFYRNLPDIVALKPDAFT
jgi:hypoxanthine phosphoribosyltransferase